MAERYRLNGRYVTREQAEAAGAYIRETFRGGLRVRQEYVGQEAPEAFQQRGAQVPSRAAEPTLLETYPNWDDDDTPLAVIRQANGQPLSASAFDEPPDGVNSFQVRFIVPDSATYPRGWVSYSRVGMDQWDNLAAILADGRADFNARGVGAIVFYRAR